MNDKVYPGRLNQLPMEGLNAMTSTPGTANLIYICSASQDINEIIIPRVTEELGGEPEFFTIWDFHYEAQPDGSYVLHLAADFFFHGKCKTMQAEWIPGSDPFEYLNWLLDDYDAVWGT